MPRERGAALLYECSAGISGDMHLGAMHALGVPEDALRAVLAKLGRGDEFTLTFEAARRQGLAGTLATVSRQTPPRPGHAPGLAAINRQLSAAELPQATARHAREIFHLLAEAEAQVHGIGINDVHFHEVGAIDALVDITAAAFALAWLEPAAVYCAGVELGGGQVHCDHGLLPVPAPATAALLQGLPTSRGAVTSEATTPTGAAILRHAVTHWSTPTGLWRSTALGYGCGQKDFPIPNLLRVSTLTAADSGNRATLAYRQDLELTATLDDMTPEALGRLQTALWRAGALDVTLTATLMKKQRPAHRLGVLVAEATRDDILNVLFTHSTTIGVRGHDVQRWLLPRRIETVPTRHGAVRVKQVTLPNGAERYKVEHDDLAPLLDASAAPFQTERELYADVDAFFLRRKANDENPTA